MINFFPLPDARSGSGYGNLSGGLGGDRKTGSLWPYIEITDLEFETENDDSVDDEKDAITAKVSDHKPHDHLGNLNHKPHAFVKSSTRGLTGIMASVEPKDILEVLAGAIGQASPSYNVTGADGTTRTRPGRTTGSKRGWFQPHPPKPSDPDIHRYSLKDIAFADEHGLDPLEKVKVSKKKIDDMNDDLYGQNETLSAYIRFVVDSL